ncbi:MAG: biotin/lipoate--protein ligase family protein [Pseudomonadota bacterium]
MASVPGVIAKPSLPEGLTGTRTPNGIDPLQHARMAAMMGCEPGLLAWDRRTDAIATALVVAPDVPLQEAVTCAFALAVGFADALTEIGPAELTVHHAWPASLRVNGKACGRLRATASAKNADEVPDWLVVAIDVPVEPGGMGAADHTCLHAEGCSGIATMQLVDTWAAHTQHWLRSWQENGAGPLLHAWTARAWQMGEPLPDGSGTFLGLDAQGGMQVDSEGSISVRPLTDMLGTG